MEPDDKTMDDKAEELSINYVPDLERAQLAHLRPDIYRQIKELKGG